MDDCIFCKIIKKEIPGKIIYEDDVCVAFLDLTQVTDGHTLVVPKKHSKNIFDTDPIIGAHVFNIAQQLSHRICNRLSAKGCNILSNANEVAGQSVNHFHVHIIPRYDENDGISIKMKDRSDVADLDRIFVELIK